jgi:hypothetical protein
MPNPMIRIHNSETDKIVDREMTAQEFAAYQLDQTAEATRQAASDVKTQAKAAIAERLGLTDAELAILLA